MLKFRSSPWIWAVCACALLPACNALGQGTLPVNPPHPLAQTPPPPPPLPPGQPCPCGKGVVFVANGSGNLHGTSSNLESAIKQACLPLTVERVAWSHGWCRPFWDLLDHANLCTQAEQLAATVLAYRAANPTDRIYLVGHSCGAAVVLGAAEHLPPMTVDRIILLAPAVSCSYDLRAALAASREGIDSFYSRHDEILSTFVLALGPARGNWGETSAGWFGFQAQAAPGCDESLYCNLRQHSWQFGCCKTGNLGGHFGCTRSGHLRDQVLPLLACDSPTAAVPPPPTPAAMPAAAAERPRTPTGVVQTSLQRLSHSAPAEPAAEPETAGWTPAGLAAGYRPRK